MRLSTIGARARVLALTASLLAGGSLPALAQEAEDHASAEAQQAETAWFRVGAWRTWFFRSFLKDETDDANTLGLELESYFTFGNTQIKNIAYLEVANHPRAIPGQPQGNPVPEIGEATGIADLLTGFWVSKKGEHHEGHHFAPGIGLQLPTASSPTLGSEKWSLGPSIDYEYGSGRWFAGAIAMQLWSVAGASDREDVSMLLIKCFVYYTLSDRWDLMYVPYGISVYWLKDAGEKMYLPLGGGAQYKTHIGSAGLNLAAQLFYNVVRPSKGTVWDLRLLAEIAF